MSYKSMRDLTLMELVNCLSPVGSDGAKVTVTEVWYMRNALSEKTPLTELFSQTNNATESVFSLSVN